MALSVLSARPPYNAPLDPSDDVIRKFEWRAQIGVTGPCQSCLNAINSGNNADIDNACFSEILFRIQDYGAFTDSRYWPDTMFPSELTDGEWCVSASVHDKSADGVEFKAYEIMNFVDCNYERPILDDEGIHRSWMKNESFCLSDRELILFTPKQSSKCVVLYDVHDRETTCTADDSAVPEYIPLGTCLGLSQYQDGAWLLESRILDGSAQLLKMERHLHTFNCDAPFAYTGAGAKAASIVACGVPNGECNNFEINVLGSFASTIITDTNSCVAGAVPSEGDTQCLSSSAEFSLLLALVLFFATN